MPRKPKSPKPPDPDVEVFELYGKQVRLEYKDSSHRYKVSDNGSKPEQVPSVTTILNILNKPAILEWAVRVVCDDVESNLRALIAGNSFSVDQIFKVITEARSAHTRLKEEAAEIGVSTHDWLAGYWRAVMAGNQASYLVNMPEEGHVQNCINAALNWFAEHEIKPLYVECPQYSREYKISGRSDFIGIVDGRMAVIDYKSTKSLYPEIALQMAAYARFHLEEYKNATHFDRYGLRLNKETGDFEARKYMDLESDWDTFLACFKLYDRLKHLRRVSKPDPDEWLQELG